MLSLIGCVLYLVVALALFLAFCIGLVYIIVKSARCIIAFIWDIVNSGGSNKLLGGKLGNVYNMPFVVFFIIPIVLLFIIGILALIGLDGVSLLHIYFLMVCVCVFLYFMGMKRRFSNNRKRYESMLERTKRFMQLCFIPEVFFLTVIGFLFTAYGSPFTASSSLNVSTELISKIYECLMRVAGNLPMPAPLIDLLVWLFISAPIVLTAGSCLMWLSYSYIKSKQYKIASANDYAVMEQHLPRFLQKRM